MNGGEGGVRTNGALARSPGFKTGAFEHSADYSSSITLITRLNN